MFTLLGALLLSILVEAHFPEDMSNGPGIGLAPLYQDCPKAQECHKAVDIADECLAFLLELEDNPNPRSKEGQLSRELEQLYESCLGIDTDEDYDSDSDSDTYEEMTTPAPERKTFGKRRGKRDADDIFGESDMESIRIMTGIEKRIMEARTACDQVAVQSGCSVAGFMAPEKLACEKEIESKEAELSALRLATLRKIKTCVDQALASQRRSGRVRTGNRRG